MKRLPPQLYNYKFLVKNLEDAIEAIGDLSQNIMTTTPGFTDPIGDIPENTIIVPLGSILDPLGVNNPIDPKISERINLVSQVVLLTERLLPKYLNQLKSVVTPTSGHPFGRHYCIYRLSDLQKLVDIIRKDPKLLNSQIHSHESFFNNLINSCNRIVI